ncbi:MAG: hypothetical protein ACFFBD_04590 [Candidatus Hodarchaeota archaeon]
MSFIFNILRRIVDIIFLILGKIRQLIEGLLGFGRPLEALFLGGTFVLVIIAIIDHYTRRLIETNNWQLPFIALLIFLIFINAIYSYGLTFFFQPPRSPSELAQRIMWNFAFVINVLISSTYVELILTEYTLAAELILLTAFFLIVLSIASWLKPALLASKDIAEGLKILRENIGSAPETVQEGNRVVREGLRLFRLEIESLFRLFRISHIVLLSVLLSAVSVIIYEIVDVIGQTAPSVPQLPAETSLIIVWVILILVVIIILFAGLKRADFLNVKGEMEQGLLDAELELN